MFGKIGPMGWGRHQFAAEEGDVLASRKESAEIRRNVSKPLDATDDRAMLPD
jgi:hypothetical protein